ncbi:ATP-binding protein [Tumebacillus flagellatus]|uniref:Helicase HerA central domain-containing protein n=1 Tax=Tumebacillus flagellatus TaxID=1157490 RepID=A0A074MEQ9_9BACL|nr:ATP-binding protein [Tumebacillus flagellatus]KEO84277.1 hypothetical protein EL26_05790 [Tumebacillus flagellatus]
MDMRIGNYCIGKVRSVDGSNILVKAEALKIPEYDGHPAMHVEVGAYVNCGDFHGDTICMVSRVRIEEVEKKGIWEENNLVELSIVGSVNDEGRFTRGVDQLPHITCDVYLLNGEQVNSIMGIDDHLSEDEKRKFFKVGKRSMKGGGDVYFDLDKLLGRHVAIVGTTGSGKSSTVARITQSILTEYPQPRIMFFDLHNEYRDAFGGQWAEKTNLIDWDNFSLPYWYLDLEEFIGIYYPGAGGTQEVILKGLIEELKKDNVEEDKKSRVSVDSPIFFDIEELIKKLDALATAETTATKKEPFQKLSNRISAINKDPRFDFLNRERLSQKKLGEYFTELLGVCEETKKYITILDLSGLPAEVRTISVGVLARLCFDYRYWDMDPENLPLALVLEEAHSYIPDEREATYALCLNRVEKIAKEGRKYGISLIVVTQRPSNVSTTVLSQCGTFITLRLTSDLDQNKVRRLLPDTIGEQAEMLSSLRDREALVTGDAVSIPGRVRFDEPNPWPKSKDVKFHKAWTDGPPVGYDIDSIVEAWSLREKRTTK